MRVLLYIVLIVSLASVGIVASGSPDHELSNSELNDNWIVSPDAAATTIAPTATHTAFRHEEALAEHANHAHDSAIPTNAGASALHDMATEAAAALHDALGHDSHLARTMSAFGVGEGAPAPSAAPGAAPGAAVPATSSLGAAAPSAQPSRFRVMDSDYDYDDYEHRYEPSRRRREGEDRGRSGGRADKDKNKCKKKDGKWKGCICGAARTLQVSAEGQGRAPATRAALSFEVTVKSKDLRNVPSAGSIRMPVSGRFGNVTERDSQNDQILGSGTPQNITMCASCVQREVSRRMASVLNFIINVNATYNATAEEAHGATLTPRSRTEDESSSPYVTRLRTTQFTIRSEYNYINGTQVHEGYTGTNAVTFNAPIPMISRVLDRILDVGATTISSITLVATAKDTLEAAREAESNAMENLLERVRIVFKSLKMDANMIKFKSLSVGPRPTPTSGHYNTRNFAPMAAGFAGAEMAISSDTRAPIVSDEILLEARVNGEIILPEAQKEEEAN